MQLYFIRHAQSENNLLWEQTRSSKGRVADPELTPKGVEQAKCVADLLGMPAQAGVQPWRDPYNRLGFGLTHLYSSLMVRALDTAAVISAAAGIPLVARMDCFERGGIYLTDEKTGEREGLGGNSFAYLQNRYPNVHLPKSFSDEGWWGNKPYETKEDAVGRARQLWANLLEGHNENDRVGMVSHGGFLQPFMAAALKQPNAEIFAPPFDFNIFNTGITRLSIQGDFVHVVYHNRIDHLPTNLATS